MFLPDIIGPISPNGNDMNGIIHTIRQTVSDPISSGFIGVTASGTGAGDPNEMVLSSSTTYWESTNYFGSYIQFDFVNRYIKPTHYSFRGRSGYCFAKSWELFGFNDGEESDSSKWFLLGDNVSSGKSYCEPLVNNGCGNENVGTFSVRPAFIGFRYLRWSLKECSCYGSFYMTYRGIDIFGTLSSNQHHFSEYISSKCNKCPEAIYAYSHVIVFLISLYPISI